jgi:hypothetical protein
MTLAGSFFLALMSFLHALSAILSPASSPFPAFRQQGQKMNRTPFLSFPSCLIASLKTYL